MSIVIHKPELGGTIDTVKQFRELPNGTIIQDSDEDMAIVIWDAVKEGASLLYVDQLSTSPEFYTGDFDLEELLPFRVLSGHKIVIE